MIPLIDLRAKLIAFGLKLLALLGVLALIVGALALYGAHERGIGAAGMQAKWDAAKAQQAAISAKATAENATRTLDWAKQFQSIGSNYEVNTHANPPSVAESVAAGVADGSVRLRDDHPATCAGSVSAATARSRAADAAATQALADRTATAIAAVRIGDAADASNQQCRAQVIALQQILRAERARQ